MATLIISDAPYLALKDVVGDLCTKLGTAQFKLLVNPGETLEPDSSEVDAFLDDLIDVYMARSKPQRQTLYGMLCGSNSLMLSGGHDSPRPEIVALSRAFRKVLGPKPLEALAVSSVSFKDGISVTHYMPTTLGNALRIRIDYDRAKLKIDD